VLRAKVCDGVAAELAEYAIELGGQDAQGALDSGLTTGSNKKYKKKLKK